uniref:Enkurin domain-containing protein n=1 Tax=Phaeomonas parva TaxID=124430 RepID=A0A7S1UIH2_9STRA|mmetsp:Transcript_731/g.1817  ORF Transcript_731/g.1817 Transcript_731/m.1817 type:complete len:275 (+) Transcript_731:93-917(+)|eukprot:CAMPEP_0118870382 /NCGR_PEP_ID=MMETSP1163-20130328/13372_1 /TAXON_ID=124430 /ORGANISM="Phaeomonas parva, Strain CCMP2877" /LENGTH=274 /DNA_ID=CAMNT_0006805379 /DNA_START=22 /DNA_END=846 /DNA_ORIENTATION=+
MNETIYNLVQTNTVEAVKPPMYRSKHDPMAPLVGSTIGTFGTTRINGAGIRVEKKDSSLFSPIQSTKPDPKTFLRKAAGTERTQKRLAAGSNTLGRSTRKYEFSQPIPDPVVPPKPSVPRREDRPIYGLTTSKNFIVSNAIEAILQVPGESKPGEPDYLAKPDYGQVPGYLEDVKKEIDAENEMIDAYVRDHLGVQEEAQEMVEEMDELERQMLIEKLKAKWEKVNSRYQRITHVVKMERYQMRRKELMEQELSALEKQIALLGRPGPMYVADA